MHFISLFPDEHVYSGLIRARYLSGQMYINDRHFFEFNQLPFHWLRSQVPLCSNLRAVLENVSSNSVRQFKFRLFHTPFSPWLLSLPDNILPEELLESGMRNNLEENPFSVDRRWKFCPICAEEELSQYGVSYWHSLHQSLGARVCNIHNSSLYSHNDLRYLNFSLPQHWPGKAQEMVCENSWQSEWQAFIYSLTNNIQKDINFPLKLRKSIRTHLKIEGRIKMKDKLIFNDYFAKMSADIGEECLAGLFASYATEQTKKPNILWVTLSGKSQANGLRHPLYWLSILFWLRNDLPELEALND